MTQLRIKICGITLAEDALFSAELGAFAVGFIFYSKSPRYIPPERAAAIIEKLPASVLPVGVFVNAPPLLILQTARIAGLRAVQLHGDEPPEDLIAVQQGAAGAEPLPASLMTLRAVRCSGAMLPDLSELRRHRPSLGYVVDAAVAGQYGGTGKPASFSAARRIQQLGPVFLSGGLRPDNVAAALYAVRPEGIDVCSGVEESPGRKCHARLSALFRSIDAASVSLGGRP